MTFKDLKKRVSLETTAECMVGLTSILKEAWNTAINAEDKREKIQALSVAKESYSMKLDLLTNATVVDDAIRFVIRNRESATKQNFIGSDTKSELNNNIF